MALKDLIKLKPSAPAESLNPAQEEKSLQPLQQGFSDSKNTNGSTKVLKASLDALYQKYENRCRKDDVLQEDLKRPHKEALAKEASALKGVSTKIQLCEDEVKACEQEISTIDHIIARVRTSPEEFGLDIDRKPRAQFYIGLVLLLIISVYLIVFYMSASYSAFFKDFESAQVLPAIFDADAFTKAIEDGWLEALFVGTIPFAFMGLGYLIHMFQRAEKKLSGLKVLSLFIVTFVFDVILAYQIDHKIFEFDLTGADRAAGVKHTMMIAFTEARFWGIIFAGFVVYIIWGLIFDFVMKEYDNLDKVRVFIGTKRKERKIHQQAKTDLLASISEFKHKSSDLQSEISRIQGIIDSFIFPSREYLNEEKPYFKGWLQAVQRTIALPDDEKKALLDDCARIEKAHLVEHNISIVPETEITTARLNIS